MRSPTEKALERIAETHREQAEITAAILRELQALNDLEVDAHEQLLDTIREAAETIARALVNLG